MELSITDKEDDLTTSDGKKFYPKFRWEGDDLILENSDTFLNEAIGKRVNRERPEVVFGTKLVEAMKWITYDGGDSSFFMMEGNLMTEADSISKDVEKD